MPIIKSCVHCGQKNRIPSAHLSDAGVCGACKAPIPPAAEPIEVDAALFDEILQAARVPVLVDFWASWCGPCRMAAPEVAKAAASLAGKAIVLKVDTEAHPELSARFRVQSIPNFIVFRGGKVLLQQAGATTQSQMEQWLRQASA